MTLDQIDKQKRKPRSYKVRDDYYDRAMKRAKKEYVTLAQCIEAFVESYADGAFGKVIFSNSKKQTTKSDRTPKRK